RDGILDVFDGYTGPGTQQRPFAQNTNGSTSADYIQVNADANARKAIANSLYKDLDANFDGKIDSNIDVDMDGIMDTRDTNISAMGSPRMLNRKLYANFDGRNDYASSPKLFSNGT